MRSDTDSERMYWHVISLHELEIKFRHFVFKRNAASSDCATPDR